MNNFKLTKKINSLFGIQLCKSPDGDSYWEIDSGEELNAIVRRDPVLSDRFEGTVYKGENAIFSTDMYKTSESCIFATFELLARERKAKALREPVVESSL